MFFKYLRAVEGRSGWQRNGGREGECDADEKKGEKRSRASAQKLTKNVQILAQERFTINTFDDREFFLPKPSLRRTLVTYTISDMV